MKIAIIGGGRLGTSLGLALAKCGFKVQAVSDLNRRLAAQSCRLIGMGRAMADNAQAARQAPTLFLCLPDDTIKSEVLKMARAGLEWRGKTVFHCSGLLSSKVLRPLRLRGAQTASFHPAQSFPRKGMPPSVFRNIFISLEGDRAALSLGRSIARRLGAFPFSLRETTRPLYHAACSLASNHTVVLFLLAARFLAEAGLSVRKAEQVLHPLVQGTLHNVKKIGAAESLTGPVVRGDTWTVARHLQVLRRHKSLRKVYQTLAAEALRLAARAGLEDRKVRALRRLLAGK